MIRGHPRKKDINKHAKKLRVGRGNAQIKNVFLFTYKQKCVTRKCTPPHDLLSVSEALKHKKWRNKKRITLAQKKTNINRHIVFSKQICT